MKTQNVNNKLKFDKNSVSELNDAKLNEIGAQGSVGITISYHEICTMKIPNITILIEM